MDLPLSLGLAQSLDDLGGWQNCDIAEWFADYMTLVGQRYGNRVKPLWRSRQAICHLQ